MAKRAKKKSVVSRSVRTVKKAAKSAAKTTKRAVKKMMPGKRRQKRNLPDNGDALALIARREMSGGTTAKKIAQQLSDNAIDATGEANYKTRRGT